MSLRGNAIVLRHHGDAGQLRSEPIELAEPAPGELLVRQTAIGVNFHDIYVRTGQYKTLPLPGIPGVEATGIVEAVGDGVDHWRVGDRLGYVSSRYGAYASRRVLDARIAIRLPDDIDDDIAAANMVRGLTVEMLLHAVHHLESDETILVHAAAGGVGRLLVQAASRAGARVIGTVGSIEKAAIARQAGAWETILYRNEDFVERINDLTAGDGVTTVYDSVGKDTIDGSIEVLARCGHLVMFGQSSGPCAPIELPRLAAKSLTVSRPILFDYLADPARANAMAAKVFGALRSGALVPPAIRHLPLAEASSAHRIIEGRDPHGSVVLRPEQGE